MREKVVEIESLWFRYQMAEDWVLRNLNLVVHEGEFTAIMGPSGCGKSTLLYILTGIIPNMIRGELRGSIRIFGRDILKLPQSEIVRNVGFIFQNPDSQLIMPTVYEEVIYGLENLGLDGGEIEARAREVLEYTGLWAKRDYSPWSLSAGERQILAIASVLAMRPRLLILDEPTSMLDHRGTSRVLELISRIKREIGITVIVVEHKIEWASEIADRIVIMDKGEFVLQGRPEEVFSNIEAIRRIGVRPPMVSEVFYRLSDLGYRVKKIPVTASEGLREIINLTCRGGEGGRGDYRGQ